MELTIIGGGLAGCEAAWQAARRGVSVTLCEMKPESFSPAHKSEGLAELVCSNSLRSNDPHNAAGLLKEEMRQLGSLIIEAADRTRVPAGSALAVDRDAFSSYITKAIEDQKNVRIVRGEVHDLPPAGITVIATGPLTSVDMAESIAGLIGEEYLYFYDAISPIVDAESIDFGKAFRASRYGRGDDDYINCPMDEDVYHSFVNELLSGEQVKGRAFEREVFFEGCMPIEVMAKRGTETLAYGPMKPVGLCDPGTGRMPYAVVQLRQENTEATMYNMVGFQTRLKHLEQKRIFRMIPGLESASFLRLGSMHRNTYINSPAHLLSTLQLKERPDILLAGQITGVEGYIESASMGIIAGINAERVIRGDDPVSPPATTAMGGLLRHITEAARKRFQPMNVNFGLLPPLKGNRLKKAEKKASLTERAIRDMTEWAKML